MLKHHDLDDILESRGYSIQKKGRQEKKIPIGVLKGKYAPNFDSVGVQNGYIVNIELVNPSRLSKGGYAAGDSSLKLGRIDKFYQLCKDKACKKGLLIIIQYDRDGYYEKALTSRPERFRKLKQFKKNLPGGKKTFSLIDAEIVVLRYSDDHNKAKTAIEQTLSKYCFP